AAGAEAGGREANRTRGDIRGGGRVLRGRAVSQTLAGDRGEEFGSQRSRTRLRPRELRFPVAKDESERRSDPGQRARPDDKGRESACEPSQRRSVTEGSASDTSCSAEQYEA